MDSISNLADKIKTSDFKAIARAITVVENDLAGADELLMRLKVNLTIPVIGITGPPGAGKSTLVNALINEFLKTDLKIAVLAIDPTSPFNFGSLLGDRIRMGEQFTKKNVFIRSLATRGSLGGLSAKAIEITDVLRAGGFDYIFVETVGVGQSEVEIAGLADITTVVLVPEAGDEIQHIKSGLMEIADIFVVNKADREGANTFVANLKKMIAQKHSELPVLLTTAHLNNGIEALAATIKSYPKQSQLTEKKILLLAAKAIKLIEQNRLKDINKKALVQEIAAAALLPDFNLYRFVGKFFRNS